MNAKNLPLKFAFVAIAVAMCLWGLYMNGLRWGIDLQGGHSLTYEIRPAEGKDEVEPGVVDQTLAVLKNRVDPRGLLNTEWRAVGRDQIEVRIPAGSAESKRARDNFFLLLQRLDDQNLSRADLRRLGQMDAQQRQAQIVRIAAGHEELAAQINKVVAHAQAIASIQRQLETATGDQAQQLQDQLENELAQHEVAVRKALAYNLSSARVQDVLGLYTPGQPNEAFKNQWAKLVNENSHRKDQIEQIRQGYEKWALVRQPLDNPADLKRLISKAGILEFRIAPVVGNASESYTVSDAQWSRYVQSLKEEGPDALARRNEPFMWFAIHEGEEGGFSGLITGIGPDQRRYVLLSNAENLTMLHRPGQGDWKLINPGVDTDKTGKPAVSFEFDERGAQLFHRLTSQNRGQRMAIILDDEAYSAPRIENAISNRGIITMGNPTPDEVNELVQTLRSGSLPGRLNQNPVAERSFGPTLGEVNKQLGIRAGVYGLIAVAAFMMIYYLLAGAIANFALLLNVVLVVGAMSLIQAVFTLPGLAGVILTIGMAVDANVLVFERLREEQEKGQSIRLALKNAYERAFSAIFDSNLTTLITCLILGWVGTEEVRGFAITLGMGVVFSMFTALVVTRWIFQLLLERNLIKNHIGMLRLVGVPRINWMSKRYVFWAVSAAVLAFGLTSLFSQGSELLGIEFRGGTQATAQLKFGRTVNGKVPNVNVIRDALTDAATKLEAEQGGYSRLMSSQTVVAIDDPDAVNNFLRAFGQQAGGSVSLEQFLAGQGDKAYFQSLDANKDNTLSADELRAMPPYMYEISTTESDLPRIRRAIEVALGESLDVRQSVDYKVAKSGQAPLMNVALSAQGATAIDQAIIAQASAAYRELLGDFEGGLLVVITDLSPAQTEAQVEQRIEEMRQMKDYSAQRGTLTQVVGLQLAEGSANQFQSLAVLLKPVAAVGDRAAAAEVDLVAAALDRSESIPTNNVGPQIAGETARMAIVAVILSWLAMIAYLWLRFGSVQWGLVAVVCLVHDALIVLGMVALSDWLAGTPVGTLLALEPFKIDLPMVAAVLTVIGYSVNDTIVVFDRIRENRGKLTTVSAQVINGSINQTLSRTLMTSFTTLLVVLIMYIWGGPGIHAFNYALLVGIVFGTYSSVAIAAPLLMGFKKALLVKASSASEPVTASAN